jgi:hypothetical protein
LPAIFAVDRVGRGKERETKHPLPGDDEPQYLRGRVLQSAEAVRDRATAIFAAIECVQLVARGRDDVGIFDRAMRTDEVGLLYDALGVVAVADKKCRIFLMA